MQWDEGSVDESLANLQCTKGEKPIGFTNVGYNCSLISIIQALDAVIVQRFPMAWAECTHDRGLTPKDLIPHLNKDFQHRKISGIKSFKCIKSLKGLNFEPQNKSALEVLDAILKEIKQFPSPRRLLCLEYTIECQGHQQRITTNDILVINKKCPTEKGCDGTLKYEVAESVNILIIALKTPPTIRRPVCVENVNLEITEDIVSNFELVAVINHETDGTGHFTCVRKDLDGGWWYCDDHHVQAFEEVKKNTSKFQRWKPHLLFYVRRKKVETKECIIL